MESRSSRYVILFRFSAIFSLYPKYVKGHLIPGDRGFLSRQLATLPFEKKIEIIVELQKAAGVREDLKRQIWPI
jgi:hypothetical protein